MAVYNVRIQYDNFKHMNECTRELIRPTFFSTIERNIYFKDYPYDKKISILVEGVCDKNIPFQIKDVLDKFPLQMFMDVCDQLPDANKNEHVLEVMAIPLHRQPRSTPRPSFMRSMYRRLTQRRSRSTRTEPPEITPEAYRKWYMKACIHFLKRGFEFIGTIDNDVLVDKEFARMAVVERVDMKDLGLSNRDLEDIDHLEHLRTLREINKYVDDILRQYQYDTDEIRMFIYHYLSIRLKDKVNLLLASSVDPIERKTKVKSVVPEMIIKSYLGGNSRRKRKRTKRLLR